MHDALAVFLQAGCVSRVVDGVHVGLTARGRVFVLLNARGGLEQ